MQGKIKICKTDFLQTKRMWNQKWLKICLTDFFKNFGSKRESPQRINCENFIISCTVGFRAILHQRQLFTTLDENWIAHALYLSARSCDAMYRVRESKSKLELFYWMFMKLFFQYLFSPRLEDMFERSLKLSLDIPKRFNAFQVLFCLHNSTGTHKHTRQQCSYMGAWASQATVPFI